MTFCNRLLRQLKEPEECNLIPLAHPLLLQAALVNFDFIEEVIYCELTVKGQGKTADGMEALTSCPKGL